MRYFRHCTDRLGPMQMNYAFSISLKHRYFFCEVSKAGCSAIKSELWRHELADVPLPAAFRKANLKPHAPITQHVLIKPFQLGRKGFNAMIKDPGVTKWAVVRNPFVRALSGYLDKVRRNQPSFANLALRVALLRGEMPDAVTHESVSFEEFCEALTLFDAPSQFDQHWRPQYEHICADILPYDLIVKLEELDARTEELSARLDLPELRFAGGRRHATDAQAQLSEYYSDRTADLIRSVYANDFKNFEYETDVPT